MNAEEYSELGYQQLQQEKYEEALRSFERALAQESTHPDSLYGLARAHFKLEEFEESIVAFDRLINLIPNNAVYYSERGVALHWTGNNELAMTDFDRAVELEPDNPYRYSSRAYIKDRLQDFQGAIDDYSQAIALDPEDAIAYNNRGIIEEKLGHLTKAKASYQRADNLDFDGSSPTTARERLTARPPSPTATDQSSGSLGAYWREIQSVFTSRSQFQEFVRFLSKTFRKS